MYKVQLITEKYEETHFRNTQEIYEMPVDKITCCCFSVCSEP